MNADEAAVLKELRAELLRVRNALKVRNVISDRLLQVMAKLDEIQDDLRRSEHKWEIVDARLLQLEGKTIKGVVGE